MAQFPRSQTPPACKDYRGYLPYLRLDFRGRCAYCERTEFFLGGEEFFEIDHFRPRSRPEFRHLVAAYTNLYYCCGKCNRLKGSTWPSPKQTLEGFRFSDPCAEDMYVAHLQETGSGHLEALTQCGRYTCENIRLDRPDLVAWRRAKRATAMDIAKLEKTARELEILALAAADSAEREQRLEEIRALRDRIEEARRRFCF